ncbi:TPA: AAA family ATPase [Burkholderia vietnamiensis]|nr:AAA family ATPase [Burkholderia vietnamiensis]
MLIAVATRKGGVGKTTIATNLAANRAAAGHSVKLIDSDYDEYAHMWGMLRRQNEVQPNILLAKMTGNIYADLMAERESTDTVIVDVGGKHSPELVYAVGACDVLVLPVRAGQFDVWSLTAMGQMVSEMHASGKTFRVVPVMNAISPQSSSSLTAGLKGELERLEKYFPAQAAKIVQRDAFSWAAAEGKGVCELKRGRDTEKAQDEINTLYAEVFQ